MWHVQRFTGAGGWYTRLRRRGFIHIHTGYSLVASHLVNEGISHQSYKFNFHPNAYVMQEGDRSTSHAPMSRGLAIRETRISEPWLMLQNTTDPIMTPPSFSFGTHTRPWLSPGPPNSNRPHMRSSAPYSAAASEFQAVPSQLIVCGISRAGFACR